MLDTLGSEFTRARRAATAVRALASVLQDGAGGEPAGPPARVRPELRPSCPAFKGTSRKAGQYSTFFCPCIFSSTSQLSGNITNPGPSIKSRTLRPQLPSDLNDDGQQQSLSRRRIKCGTNSIHERHYGGYVHTTTQALQTLSELLCS